MIIRVILAALWFMTHMAAFVRAEDKTPGDEIETRTFYSNALQRNARYSVFIPKGRVPEGGWPLVMLLHGAGRNDRTVPDDPICRPEVLKSKFVIIFPDAAQGWYIDSPAIPSSKYQSMILELLQIARKELPVSAAAERTGVCGWSMGGYGAMWLAEAVPNEIRAVATGIALLDYPEAKMAQEAKFPIVSVFGKDEAKWRDYNCMTHAEKLRGRPILIVAGTKAWDYPMNQNFHARLEEMKIPHLYRETPEGHSFQAVRRSVPMWLEFMGQVLNAPYPATNITLHEMKERPPENAMVNSRRGKFHLFILSGQSNMVALDPAISFTPTLQRAFPGDEIVIVKDAANGQEISSWFRLPRAGESAGHRGTLYLQLIDKVKQVLAEGIPDTITFVWMQGEGDSKPGLGELYGASLRGLIACLRADLGREDINVVIGRISDWDLTNSQRADWTKVRDAQVAVAKADPRAAWIDTDDLNGPKNDLHYPREQSAILATRFAENAAELIRRHKQTQR